MGRFDGQVAFVSGASSGIGAAVASELAGQGARVVLGARRREKLEERLDAIQEAGGEALAVVCDVTDRASLDRAVDEIVETCGGLDLVLANAGFGVGGNVAKLETEDFRRQFETNFFGALDTFYAVLPHLLGAKGRFGIVGSVAGKVGSPGTAAYCASKFAVAGWAESAYFDLARSGVSVTCINPGFVASDIRSINNRGEHTGRPDPAPSWLVMPVEIAAEQIVDALYHRKPEVTITLHGKLLVWFKRHMPWLLRGVMRLGNLTKRGDDFAPLPRRQDGD